MDKKLAKENIGTSRTLLSNLKQGRFKNAKKDIKKIEKNLTYIKKEIGSGKAKHEHQESKHRSRSVKSSNIKIKFPRVF